MTDIRCINFFCNTFLTQITNQNVKTISNFPFMNPNNFTVCDRLIEMPKIGYIRTEITRFLQPFFKLGLKIPAIFSNIKDEHFEECQKQTNFIPEGITPRQLFTCSTFPSLFSYCWCSEYQTSYICHLYDIAKSSIEQVKSEGIKSITTFFRKSWVFDCIRSYIYSSDIQNFIRVSIGDILVEVPKTFTDTQKYCNVLFNGLNLTIETMIQNLALIPKDVKFLFKKFSELASETDEVQKMMFVDFIFFECVLKPALSNILAFVSPRKKAKASIPNKGYDIVLQLWSLILNSCLVEEANFKEVDFSNFNRDALVKFYKKLTTVDATDSDNDLSIVKFLNVADIHYNTSLLSLPDVFLLGFLVTMTVPSDDRIIYPAAASLVAKAKEADFRFFRHESWDFDLFGLQKPEVPIPCNSDASGSRSSTPDALRQCSVSLFKYLSISDFSIDAPSDSLTKFLNFKEIESTLCDDTKVKVYLWNLRYKLEKAKGSEPQILGALLSEIEDQKQTVAKNNTTITDLSITIGIFQRQIKRFHKNLEQLMPILHKVILLLFITENPELANTISSNVFAYLTDKIQFDLMMNAVLSKLADFVGQFAPYALFGVVSLFHLELTKTLTFTKFADVHQRFIVNDVAFKNIQQNDINEICSVVDSESLPNSINYVIFLFRIALKAEIPLISIKHINKGIKFLSQISSIYQTNTKKMILYSILKVNKDNLFSYVKYMKFTLDGLKIKGQSLIPEKKKNRLDLFTQAVKELDVILCQNKE